LNGEAHRLDALIQLQAEVGAATDAAFGRLNSRVAATRQMIWILAIALATCFYLILKRH